jgi:hypothetical protein
VADRTNIALLLSKLPADSLARRLVAPFLESPFDEAFHVAGAVLAGVKAQHEQEQTDDTAEEA